MRWRFIDPNDRQEAAERNVVIAKIDAWWREFQRKTSDLSALFQQKKEWDLAAWMEQHLQGIHPELMWEFGPALQGSGHRLVITPESVHHLRPLVRAILERRPAIDGWEFYEYRLAEDLESTFGTVDARIGYDISEFKVRVWRDEHHTIGLTYTAPQISGPDDELAFNAAFVATETLLGEEILNNWIRTIEVAPLQSTREIPTAAGQGQTKMPLLIGLERLNETVQSLMGSIRDQLPPDPHSAWVEDAQWTMWKLEPDEADDYCGQYDMFVGKSANPAQWTASHGGGFFCSERFSRCDELFCYLKIERVWADGDGAFADKGDIEDAIDEVLKSSQVGCQIGGGAGLRYFYFDLAITDVEQAISIIRQRLQAGKVSVRSWIQFYDSALGAEWVGIYDETPLPPMDLEKGE